METARILFIAGPTASGKSAAALALAETFNGEVINADAMQVYRDLRIVTARPSDADIAMVPHHLYGMLDGAEVCSAGRWAQRAADCVDDVLARRKTAILVGGTGLYFKALAEGLSPIPEVPADIRAAAQARRNEIGATAFRDEVVSRDPAMARLPEGDAQRLARAWEVYEATGAPLSSFQDLPRVPLINEPAEKILITPERESLYAACDARAAAMFSDGAIDEVKALMARKLDPALPVMKALGAPEIMSFLRSDHGRDEALELLQRNTRRFAKRQMTWFRHQAADWRIFTSDSNAVAALLSGA